ncbi:hypothetical protein ACWC5G_14155, partial [Streptomyces sp. NPDC001274]
MKETPDKAPSGSGSGSGSGRGGGAPRQKDGTPGLDVSRSPAAPGAPGGPGLQRLHHLQRAAGNRAVSRLVAQRYTAPVKPSPAQAPGFRKVRADIAAKKTRLAVHAPATTESKSAQDAAVAPPDDKDQGGRPGHHAQPGRPVPPPRARRPRRRGRHGG